MASDTSGAEELLHRIRGVLAKEEYETRQRVEAMTGLDGDYRLVSRREWSEFYRRTETLRKEYDAIVALLVQVRAHEIKTMKGYP
jgi:hypothetical protein